MISEVEWPRRSATCRGERERMVPSGCLTPLTRLVAKVCRRVWSPPLFQASRFQDAVVSFPEFYRPSVASVFIRDERAVLSEVSLRSQSQDGVHCRLIEGHIPFAGGALQLADLYLPAADGFGAFSPGNLLHTPLEVDDPVFQVDVTCSAVQGLPLCGVRCSASAYRRPPADRWASRFPRS